MFSNKQDAFIVLGFIGIVMAAMAAVAVILKYALGV